MEKSSGLIFEKSSRGRKAFSLPEAAMPETEIESLIPGKYLRKNLRFPEISELDIVRHFTHLASKNFNVDGNFYPLGSCTMKYNPKVNEDIASMEKFRDIHPMFPEKYVQGILSLLKEMEEMLCRITAMDAFCLYPAAGAHGEFLGMLLIRAYHERKGKIRKKIIVPDSSHGTNPSSVHMAGYEVVSIASDKNGEVDLEALESALDEEVAAFMMTNPNTLGLFESKILEIAEKVHSRGALLYYDGANLNPLLGICRPGDMGFDVVHLNLHKTFSTPHGGGGPGSGPVGVKKHLVPFLPVPVIEEKDGGLILNRQKPQSVGSIKSFFGNVGVIIKAYSYIKALGDEGLKRTGKLSVLNANYLKQKLKGSYHLPFDKTCMHEFVLSAKKQLDSGIHAVDIAKGLIDRGIHPPTVYFPMIVEEAIMIEPTETESKNTLDEFVNTMKEIAGLAAKTPEILKKAPIKMSVKRLDEVQAARVLDVCWNFEKPEDEGQEDG
ncbi:MAG: aminomethyl-transferring glycine dehydrogenase subunit GcvPB [Candidatus Aureabacteria bacterium]|nr:aminomethyl-transferring glycine dehydrogenase subunit GcvPB [Candidatus Auribacterota bacterium]